MTASAVSKSAVTIVCFPITVERYAYLHAMLVKEAAPVLIEQDAVGMDAHIKPGHTLDAGTKRRQDGAHPLLPEQQRLAAMQHDPDLWQPVRRGMFRDARRRYRRDARRHCARLSPPALICMLIYVTVVASQVAPAVQLQHILCDRRRHREGSDGRVEHRHLNARRLTQQVHDSACVAMGTRLSWQLAKRDEAEIGYRHRLEPARRIGCSNIVHGWVPPGRAR